MSKLVVVNEAEDTRFPFLRGMLVKSLQQAGLEFPEAYNLATDIREELDDTEEVSIEELRSRILELLEEEHPGKVLTRYRKQDIRRENLMVRREDGSMEAFSRGVHAQRLQCSALTEKQCNTVTRRVHSYLIREQIREISSKELTSITYQQVKKDVDQKRADYYLIWRDFFRNSFPLLIMIGGVPGCGKSTVATEIANRLGIVRIQSTDMLREVMRIMIPEKLSPALHTSSFSAGKAMHIPDIYENPDEHLLYGFQMQSEMVEVACQAVIQRALNENVSIIMEGVHVRPSLRQHIQSKEAVVVPVCLAALDKKRLVRFIKGRSEGNRQRRAKRYLKHLDDIWQLQNILITEADDHDVEIVDNNAIDDVVSEITRMVIQTIETSYKGRILKLRKEYQ